MKFRATISIDYDDTIVYQDFPNSGTIKPNAKEVINRLYDEGHHILIWTCRSFENAKTAKKYLIECGIRFHLINENLPSNIEKYGGDTRKMSADIYIDDRQLGGIPDDWLEIEKMIRKDIIKAEAITKAKNR
jgi:hypothetical protein